MVEHWDVIEPLPVNATYPIVFFSRISLSLSRSDWVVFGRALTLLHSKPKTQDYGSSAE
jgi:hypothetical protein